MQHDGQFPQPVLPMTGERRKAVAAALEIESAFGPHVDPKTMREALRLARGADEATEKLPVEQKNVWA